MFYSEGREEVMPTIFTMGIDIGSTSSKCVIMRDGKEIAGKAMIPFGTGTSGPERVIASALDSGRFKKEDMAYILATGYGRCSIDLADSEMSELTCHARGAYHLFPDVRTVIDIGGQDIKVLRVLEGGVLDNFVMNEKCAAGTGRFIEVMARVLEVDINDMAELSAQSTERVDISSTCTVFAESEVILQLAMKKKKSDIVSGIHRSVAIRTAGLAKRVGIAPAIVLTGGVARNHGVLAALAKELEAEIKTSPLAQYNGALGAALLAYEKISRRQPLD